MKQSLNAHDEILEEYRALRAEILALLDRQGQNANLAWSGTIALIGAAAVARLPELAILSIAYLATMWLGHLHLSSAIRRIGYYIETQIEPKMEGLRWGGICRTQYRETNGNRSMFHRIRIALSTNYGMFGIIAVVSSITLLFSGHSMGLLRLFVNLTLTALSVVWLFRVIFKAVNHPLRQTTFLTTNSSPLQSSVGKHIS